MMELVGSIITIIWFIFTIITTVGIIADKEDWENVFQCLFKKINLLFIERNIFGILLSILVCIYMIPSIILCLLGGFIDYLFLLFKIIWRLGNKK